MTTIKKLSSLHCVAAVGVGATTLRLPQDRNRYESIELGESGGIDGAWVKFKKKDAKVPDAIGRWMFIPSHNIRWVEFHEYDVPVEVTKKNKAPRATA